MCVCEEGDGAGIGDAGVVMRVVCRSTLTHLLFHTYAYTPTLTRLHLHAYAYTTTRVAMRVVCRYPLALIAEEYGYVPVNIALLVAVLKLSTLAY
jgi:hypothetical protein